MIRSIQEGEPTKVASILREFKSQFSLETMDKNGRTLLMISCQQGDLDNTLLLLKHGANINATTQSGKTPLSLAVTSGHLPIVKALLEADPTLATSKDHTGSNLLMYAAETATVCAKKGYQNGIIELLMKFLPNINETDNHGFTAFDKLCMTSGNYEGARTLIEAGARVIINVDKKHPLNSLMMAALNGHTELAKYLMYECNIDPRIKSEVNQK
jgi:ankyrin repeat protein